MSKIILLALCAATKTVPNSFAADVTGPYVAQCAEVNRSAIQSATQGNWRQAQFWVAKTFERSYTEAVGPECSGIVLSNVAVIAQSLGALDIAEDSAKKSIHELRKEHEPKDLVLFAPLHVLAVVYLQRGNLRQTRGVINEMLALDLGGRAVESAMTVGILGALHQREGNPEQAEGDYLHAIQLWVEAGTENTGKSLPVVCNLASLYMQEKRLKEAHRLLQRAEFGIRSVAAFMWDFRNAANGGNPNPFNWVLFLSGEAIGVLSFLSSLRHTPRAAD